MILQIPEGERERVRKERVPACCCCRVAAAAAAAAAGARLSSDVGSSIVSAAAHRQPTLDHLRISPSFLSSRLSLSLAFFAFLAVSCSESKSFFIASCSSSPSARPQLPLPSASCCCTCIPAPAMEPLPLLLPARLASRVSRLRRPTHLHPPSIPSPPAPVLLLPLPLPLPLHPLASLPPLLVLSTALITCLSRARHEGSAAVTATAGRREPRRALLFLLSTPR